MSDTAISAAPFVAILQPYVTLVVTTVLVPAAAAYALALVGRWTGKSVDQANADALTKEVQREAGIIMAKSATNLAGLSIKVDDPEVIAAANYVAATVPKLLIATGSNPESVARAVAGEIGKLQAPQPAPITQVVAAHSLPSSAIASQPPIERRP